MKLKERILKTAIELFNTRGIASTSPNLIAAKLNISPGNLTYHFKTKDLLVKEVYQNMSEDSKDFIKLNGYLTLNDFREIMRKFQSFKNKYSFFFDDIAFIYRNYPEVGKLIEEINIQRLKQARLLFEHYVETERMVPEEEGYNYDILVYNVWTIAAFWNIQSLIISPNTIFQKPMDMVEMAWNIIFPYLTEKGREEYEQINAYLKQNESSIV